MKPGGLRPSVPAPAKSAAEATVEAVLGGRVYVDVVVPRTQVRGSMRLVGRDEALAIIASARREFEARGLPCDAAALTAPGVINEWNCEIAARHLAVAVRDPSDTSKPLAPLAQWREECDDDQISALWTEYQDMRERFDPLAQLGALTDAEFHAIHSAAKKKELDLLMSYGSRRLAIYATTTAEPPAS